MNATSLSRNTDASPAPVFGVELETERRGHSGIERAELSMSFRPR